MKTLLGICMFLLLSSESIAQRKLITQDSPQKKNLLQKTSGFIWNGVNPVTKDKNGKVDIMMTTLLSLNLVLHSMDYSVTKNALNKGAREGNLVMKPLLKREPLGAISKTILIIAQNNLLKSAFRENRKLGYLITSLSVSAMGFVMYHNIQVMVSF